MKKRIKVKGRIKTYIQFCIYLGVLLCAVDAGVFMLDLRAGAVLAGYLLIYFAVMSRGRPRCPGRRLMPWWSLPKGMV